jgi:PKD repeat protein
MVGTPRPIALRLLALVLASALAAALTAGPAQAVIVKLPHGGFANLAPISGPGSAAGPRQFDSFFSNLDYNGGPVMPSNTNYLIVWAPSNYSGTAFQSGYVSGVARYLTDLAAASASPTNTDAVATQYLDASGEAASYRSSFGGTYTDTDPLPANACPVTSAGHICLDDAQLQSELDSFVSANGLPADLTHEYFLLTPPGVASCIDAGGSECSANADQNLAYCAYHSESSGSHVYANIPDLAGVQGCDPFVTSCPASSCAYDNGPADGVLGAVAHEHTESITDPEPSSGWSDMQPGCTQLSPMTCGGEIGDKCVGSEFGDPNIQLQSNGAGQDTPYNQTINGDHYLLQLEWSNQGHGCLDGFTPGSTTANAAFTDSPGSGTTVNFNAGASLATGGVAKYVWQWNDPAQGSTVETTGPTISHTFSSTGYYQVALTVMAADGTSSSSAATVDVGVASSPAPSFAVSPSGSTVSFDASGSSDPNPGGAIAGYNWNFGDGTTASGPAPSHTYAQQRAYTVTLTTTDTAGLTNTYSRTVDLRGAAPTAAFSETAGKAGSASSFDGTASSPASTITLYHWTFGDGGSANGPTASHVYTSPGTYVAGLTVTAQDGQSAHITHTIGVYPAGSLLAAFMSSGRREGTPVSFSSTSSAPNQDWIQAYRWSFGDGATATGANVSHRFRAGSHTVTLTVIDGYGQTVSASRVLTISDDPPQASWRERAGRGKAKKISATASDPDGRIVSYRWRFGDGATGRGSAPAHTYRRAGTYRVTLIVTDSAGRTVTITRRIRVGGSAARRR